MKSCKPLVSLLLCAALCLCVCSVGVSAAEADIGSYHVYLTASTNFSGGSIGSATVNMADGEATLLRASGSVTLGADTKAYCEMYLGADSGEYLFRGSGAVRLVIENIYCRFAFTTSGGTVYVDPTAQVAIQYIDGSIDYDVSETLKFQSVEGYSDIVIDFVPTSEVSNIFITYIAEVDGAILPFYYGETSTAYITCGEAEADRHFVAKAEQQSEEAGLLEKVVARLQGVWDSIASLPGQIAEALKLKDFFDPIFEKLQGVWDTVKELPAKIWERMEEGIQGLFIPSEEYLAGLQDRWLGLLEVKLGAVYEVIDLTYDSWGEIAAADVDNTISMPSVTIPLPEGNEFTFGGYDVKIVPDGFSALAEACKLIISIVSTLFFINGLRKRYDEVMGVEK